MLMMKQAIRAEVVANAETLKGKRLRNNLIVFRG